MKQVGFLILALLCLSCGGGDSPRERQLFTGDWRFSLSDTDASDPELDDTGWRLLNLPHDWSIESDFSVEYPATPGGGALPGGNGWYRKHFKLPESDKGKVIYIEFDGVYWNSKVWLNGHLLGFRPNGYISFRYDMTPYLNYGDTGNVLVVQADNTDQPNSRWYSGSGIYRNVWLVRTGTVHVDHWGTYITTPEVTGTYATVQVETIVKNTTAPVQASIHTTLYDSKGKQVAFATGQIPLETGVSAPFTQQLRVEHPERWHLDNPALYKAVTEIKVNNKTADRYETTFGIRTFHWDVETGFYLNDQPVKIKGVCMHHDLGCLGAAFNVRAAERQLEIMKEMGVNSIRTSHNPPAPEFLELCDRMGILVQDETFDMWRKRKSPHDYSKYFDEWYETDLRDQLRRDRNHASIFMWCIGNEVLEQWTHAAADTLSLMEANLILNAGHVIDPSWMNDTTLSVQSMITRSIANVVREMDTIRVITSGNNEVDPGNHLFRADALDVYGFNYHHAYFEPFPQNFPGKNFIVSESTSALMTRGYYEMPSDHIYIRPERWDKPFVAPENLCSSYDNCHVPWGSTHEETWKLVKKYPFISGLYVWTGFDYLGEPTPYWWPSRSSFFGIVDLAGFPKDIYYMYQSEWTDKNVLHVFPHWNWKVGEEVDIWAYYNNADEVELFLNGKSLGVKSKPEDTFHVCWRVPFASGTLQAVSRKNGQVVMEKEIHTAGAADHLLLTADRPVITADGTDLSFISVQVMDKNGNLVPDAGQLIRFTVEGDGFIAGTDNGDQNEQRSLKAPERKAFYGKAMAVVQNTGKKGTIRLTATAEGLPPATIDIKVQ